RVDGHRQRARVVAPRYAVEERAREAIAGADGGSHVLGSHLDGSKWRIARHFVGDVLVECFLRLDLSEHVARGLAVGNRSHAVQKCGTGAHVYRLAPWSGHIADRDKLRSKLFERLHHRLEHEAGACGVGMPGVWKDSAREVHRSETE